MGRATGRGMPMMPTAIGAPAGNSYCLGINPNSIFTKYSLCIIVLFFMGSTLEFGSRLCTVYLSRCTCS